jgi:hypothetical protein
MKSTKYGAKFQENENSAQGLFGESSDVQIEEPVAPHARIEYDGWKLAKEKEVVEFIFQDILLTIINLR